MKDDETVYERAVRRAVEGLGGDVHDVRGDNREFGNPGSVKATVWSLDEDAKQAFSDGGVLVEGGPSRRDRLVKTRTTGSTWEFLVTVPIQDDPAEVVGRYD